MAKYTFNIANHIRRIKNDVKESYNAINSLSAAVPTPMPTTLNIGNLANTVRNINMGMNSVKERSHNGEDYRRLFYNYDNEVLDLDGLKISNLLYADDMFLNAVNLSDSSVENIINWIPNYADLDAPWTDTLEYFGIDQNLRDNISANIDENVVTPKGWKVRDYYNYILNFTSRSPDPNIPNDDPEWTEKFFQESAENGWQKRLSVVNNTTGVETLYQNNAGWIRNQLKNIHPVILDIQGTAGTKDFSNMFRETFGLNKIVNLDISNAENIAYMFYSKGTTSFENCNLNTSKVRNMNYGFNGCLFNDLELDLSSNPTVMYALYGANANSITLKNSNKLSNWYHFFDYTRVPKILNADFSGTNSAYDAFSYAYQTKEININASSTRNIVSTSEMFNYCYSLVNAPNFLTNNVVSGGYMFNYCYSLNNVPNYNFINLEIMTNMFQGCNNLTTLPLFDLSNVYTMDAAFAGMTKMTSFQNYNTLNVTNFQNIFKGDSNLKTVPALNMQRGIYFNNAFENCFNMITANNFNTYRGLNFYNMFTNDYNLSQVNSNSLNFSSATNMACMFNQCYNLTLASLNNIVNMLPNADRFANDVYFEDMHKGRLGYFGILNWYLAEICNTATGNIIRNKGYNLTNNKTELTLKYIYDYNTMTNSTINTVEVHETFTNHTQDINIGMLNQSFNEIPRDQVKYLNMTFIADTSNIPGIAKDMTNLIEVPNIHRIEMMFRVDSAFQNCTNLTKVSNINLFNCISANYMFDNCVNLTTLNNFQTNMPRKMRRMTSAAGMFRNCRKLVDFDMNTMALNQLSSFSSIFENCVNMTTFDNINIGSSRSAHSGTYGTLAFANIPNLKTIDNMYVAASNLQNLFARTNNVTAITNSNIGGNQYTEYAFAEMDKLSNLENTNIYVGNYANFMFKNCKSLQNLDSIKCASQYNGYAVGIFEGCSNITNATFDFSGSWYMAQAYANCTNLTDVTRISMSSAKNILNIFYGANKIVNNGLYNIINALPRYENVRSANGGHGAYLGMLGINNSRDINLPWAVSKPARDKGWWLGDIAHQITGNYVNGTAYKFKVFDAPDHKDTSLNGDFIRATMSENMTRYVADINDITINNTTKIQDWSHFFDSTSQNAAQWTNLTKVNANMNNVTNGSAMFWNCANLESIGNHSFANIDNAVMMFGYTRKINQQLNINFSKITNASRMFESTDDPNTVLNCGNTLNLINCTNTNAMFSNSKMPLTFNNIYAPNAECVTSMFNNSQYNGNNIIFYAPNVEVSSSSVFRNSRITSIENYIMGTNKCYAIFQLAYIPTLTTVNTVKTDRLYGLFAYDTNLTKVNKIMGPSNNYSESLYIFNGCVNLTDAPIVENINNLTILDSMFNNCQKLVNVPMYQLDKLQQANSMFNQCVSFKNASEILHNTPVLSNASNMFRNTGVTNIKNVNLPSLTEIRYMFSYCKNLQTIDGFRVGSFTQSYVFSYDTNLITVNNFHATASSLSQLFMNCSNLQYVNNSDFTENKTAGNATSTFGNCINLKGLYNVKLNYQASFSTPFNNTPNLTELVDCYFKFTDMGTSKVQNLINTSINTLVPNAYGFFRDNPNLIQVKNVVFNGANIYGINTANNNQIMTNWSANLFMNDANLTDVELDLTGINNYANMFANDKKLTNVVLNNINSSASTANMFENTNISTLNGFEKLAAGNYEFANCKNLTDIDIWAGRDIATGIFQGCSNLTNVPAIRYAVANGFNLCPNIENVSNLTITNGVNGSAYLFPNANNLTAVSLDNIANGLYDANWNTKLDISRTYANKILTASQIANLSNYAKETIAHKHWIIPGYTANTIFKDSDNIEHSYATYSNGGPAVLGGFNIWTSMNITFFNGITTMENWLTKSSTLNSIYIDSCENVKDIYRTLSNIPTLTNLSGMNNLGKSFTEDTTIENRTLNLAASANLTTVSVNNLANTIAYVRPESHINLNRNVLTNVDINTKRLMNYKGWTIDGYTQNIPAKVIDLVTNREVFNLRTKNGGWLPALDTNGNIYLHSTTKRDNSYDEMTLTITNRIGNSLNLILNSTSENNYDYLLINKGTTTIYDGKGKNHTNTVINLTDLNVGDVLTFNYRKDSSAASGIDEYQIYFEQNLIKLTPTYTIPTGLTANIGQQLKEISLPTRWVWDNPNTILNLTGNRTYSATYTPEDTITYKKVTAPISVNVQPLPEPEETE